MNHVCGLYQGIVTTTNDPEKRMRVKAKVPQLLGDQETDWAWPCVPPGWSEGLHAAHTFTDDTGEGGSTETLTHTLHQRTPKPGQGVWIMFVAGDIEKPVWMGVWK